MDDAFANSLWVHRDLVIRNLQLLLKEIKHIITEICGMGSPIKGHVKKKNTSPLKKMVNWGWATGTS